MLRATQLRELIDIAGSSPSERLLPTISNGGGASRAGKGCRPNASGPGSNQPIRRSTQRRRIRRLCWTCPTRSAAECFDKSGLELRPSGRVVLAKRTGPGRMRATYRRLGRTEQFFGFCDVDADSLNGFFRKRKCV